MRWIVAGALLLSVSPEAARSQEPCPQLLGNGLRLETDSGDLTLDYRPGPPGIVIETRHDARPGVPAASRDVVRETHRGFIAAALKGTTPARFAYASDTSLLMSLPSAGEWTSEVRLEATGGAAAGTVIAEGQHLVRYLGETQLSLGPCSYPVWHLEHVRTMTRNIPGASPETLVYHQWWTPALGVALEVTGPGSDGTPGEPTGMSRLSALN